MRYSTATAPATTAPWRWNWATGGRHLPSNAKSRTSPDLAFGITGSRHLELSHRLAAEISPKLNFGISLLGRDTDEQATGTTDWQGATRARSLQLESTWNGPGALRVRGRLGHRRQQYLRNNLGRTSSSAGRVEVFGGGLGGRWQSQVIYELSHGSSLRNRVVYLPERYPDEGAYLEDGTYVGPEQGTHRREVLPAEIDPRQAASLQFTARENLDLTAWVDSSRSTITRMAWSATARLERESTLSDKWKLYLMVPSALNDNDATLLAQTWFNTDLTVQWKKPAVFSRVELVWNTSLDRRFESGSEEYADRRVRFQLRVPGGRGSRVGAHRGDRQTQALAAFRRAQPGLQRDRRQQPGGKPGRTLARGCGPGTGAV